MAIIRLLLLMTLLSTLEAAAPATHLLFAQRWLEHDTTSERDTLIVGTFFPDIRYLGTIPRKATHEKGLTIKKIKETTSAFKKGMRLHAYLDEEREFFIEVCSIFDHLKAIPKNVRVLFLKVLEDEILWDQIDSQAALRSLSTVYPEQLELVDEETATAWHASLRDYFEHCPSLFFQKLANEQKGFLQADAATIKEWCDLLPYYAAQPIFINYVEQMIIYVTKF